MPRISVVVVSWNGKPLLERFLPGVVADSPEAEIVVVDNGSTDGSVAWLRAHLPDVKVVALTENRGFCGGNNAGFREASGAYVVFLNNDVETTPGWLDPLAAWLDDHPRCAAVQPKLLQLDDRRRFEYAGAAGGFLDRYGFPFTRGRLFFTMEEDRGQYDVPRNIFWASGAALMLRRGAMEPDEPVFDERYFMHMEEIDLCWRLHRRGWTVACEPASTVYHLGGASLPKGDRKTFLNYRNNLLMLYRHLSPGAWRRLFPRRLALDAAAAARALASGNVGEARAIGRAYAEAHRMKRTFDADRPDREDSSVFPPYRHSVVVDYFARGRKTFAALPPDAFPLGFRSSE
ncbi:MAG: glycosyltransferase family 2 protein [Bacteroidetes bacterium]|nr:glycosyltransferase family 2 protein [Bacteroidota bacterium]